MAEVIEIVNYGQEIVQGDKAETKALKRMRKLLSLFQVEALLMMIDKYDKGNQVSTPLKEAIESNGRDVVKGDLALIKALWVKENNSTGITLTQEKSDSEESSPS